MNSARYKFRRIQIRALPMAVVIVLFASKCPSELFAQNPKAPTSLKSLERMADGKRWTTLNLNVDTVPSYCYEDSQANCLLYGRLYTWVSARRACEVLGPGWRLPTDDEWRGLAKFFGGVSEDSQDRGEKAYRTLLLGGYARFNALLGGGRSRDGQYARLQAHGFYWTASGDKTDGAWFYNFAQGSRGLHRQSGGEAGRALSVRCISN